ACDGREGREIRLEALRLKGAHLVAVLSAVGETRVAERDRVRREFGPQRERAAGPRCGAVDLEARFVAGVVLARQVDPGRVRRGGADVRWRVDGWPRRARATGMQAGLGCTRHDQLPDAGVCRAQGLARPRA